MTSGRADAPPDPRAGPARKPAGLRPHVLGILLVVLGLALINTSDAVAKWTLEAMPIALVLLFQASGSFLLAHVVAGTANPLRLIRTRDPWWQAGRSLCFLCSGACFYAGLRALQFADVIAILFVGPLVVTAMAHVFLGERVGPRRWAACAAGLIGGLVIVRPGAGAMGWGAAWPALAVLFWAVYIVVTRKISRRNTTGNMMLWASLAPLVAMAVAAPLAWETPSGWQWAGLAAIGVLSASSNGVTIRAYSLAPASLLAPFTYLEIVGATLFGWFIWREFPDLWTWVGAAVIVASGLYVLRREARAARRR